MRIFAPQLRAKSTTKVFQARGMDCLAESEVLANAWFWAQQQVGERFGRCDSWCCETANPNESRGTRNEWRACRLCGWATRVACWHKGDQSLSVPVHLLFMVGQGQVMDDHWGTMGRRYRLTHRCRLPTLERPSPPTRAVAAFPCSFFLLDRVFVSKGRVEALERCNVAIYNIYRRLNTLDRPIAEQGCSEDETRASALLGILGMRQCSPETLRAKSYRYTEQRRQNCCRTPSSRHETVVQKVH